MTTTTWGELIELFYMLLRCGLRCFQNPSIPIPLIECKQHLIECNLRDKVLTNFTGIHGKLRLSLLLLVVESH